VKKLLDLLLQIRLARIRCRVEGIVIIFLVLCLLCSFGLGDHRNLAGS